MKLSRFKVKMCRDKRGILTKVVNHSYVGRKVFGEIYTVSFNVRSIRGNHYHKLTTEWFVAIKGKLDLYLEHIKTKETELIKLDGNKPICVQIDPLVAHALVTMSNKEAILIAYSSRKYDPDKTDTYNYEVVK